jgi:hypothetical protein
LRTLIGTCEICGEEVWEEDGLLLMNSCYRCDRCGRWTCWGCGGYSTGDGYGAEDESKYRSICKECYYELQAEYASRWEAEYGAEERARGMENPYDLSEEEKEWRERLRSYQPRRDSHG